MQLQKAAQHTAQAKALQDSAKQYRNDAAKLTDNESEDTKGNARKLASDSLTDIGTPKAPSGGSAGLGSFGANGLPARELVGGDAGSTGATTAATGGDALAEIRQLSGSGDPSDRSGGGGGAGAADFGSGTRAGGRGASGNDKIQEQVVDLRAAMAGKSGDGASRNGASSSTVGSYAGAGGITADGANGSFGAGGAANTNSAGAADGVLSPVQGTFDGVGAKAHGDSTATTAAQKILRNTSAAISDRDPASKTSESEAAPHVSIGELFARLASRTHARELCFALLLIALACWLRSHMGEKRRRWYAALAALALLAYFVTSPERRTASVSIAWYTDERAALAKARELGLPVFVDIRADWCEPCREIERTLLMDPEVADKLGHFIALRIDVTKQTAEDKAKLVRFGVEGLPALVFIDTHGNVLQNAAATGAPEKHEFLTLLDSF